MHFRKRSSEQVQPPFFYGWVIVASGAGSMALGSALLFHAFGAYVVLLQDEFGWSRTTLALAFAMQRVESGLLGPVDGWLVDRFGPRKMMLVGVVIFGIGFMIFSQIQTLFGFYVAFLVMAFGNALGSFLPASVAVVNWFIRKRTTALALMMLGLAAGGLVQPVIATGLESIGWRNMAFISGIIMIVVGVPLATLLRHHPEDSGWQPDGIRSQSQLITDSSDATEPVQQNEEINFTAIQALKTRAFWYIGIGHSLSLLVMGAINVHLIAHLHESLGFSLTVAASMITVMTLTQVVGQLVGGVLGDKFDKKWLIVAVMFINAASLMILAFAAHIWLIIIFAILNGATFGARIPLTTSIRADYFGGKFYGTITGFSSVLAMWGMIFGPLIAGGSYDLLGSYTPGFIMLSLLAGLGSVIFCFVQKPETPKG